MKMSASRIAAISGVMLGMLAMGAKLHAQGDDPPGGDPPGDCGTPCTIYSPDGQACIACSECDEGAEVFICGTVMASISCPVGLTAFCEVLEENECEFLYSAGCF